MTDTETPIEVTLDALIKQMAERFLTWRLPKDFAPDGGISFDPVFNKGSELEQRRELVGTNLFTYTQAEAMARYMLDGSEAQSAEIARLKAENERLRAFANEQIRRWEQYKSDGEDYEEGCEDTLCDVAKDARTALSGESA